MKNIRLISSKIITAELYQDYNVDNDNWVNSINRHIERAMGLMRIDGFFVKKVLTTNVKNYKAPLPCDAKYLVAVLHKENKCVTRISLTRSLSLGVEFKDINNSLILEGGIDFNYLHTNFEEGEIMFIYYTTPRNEEGDVMIPDCPEVLEALPFFIINKLSLSGYTHPVISYERAMERWETLYPRAKNKMNYWSVEEAHRYSKMHNNPLFLHLIDEEWGDRYDTDTYDSYTNTLY